MSDDDVTGFVVLVIILVAFVLGLKSCDRQERNMDRDRSAKCYEQTSDKQCWGLK